MAEFVHLHCRSWFSFLAGGSSPQSLAQEAHRIGHSHLALTDVNGTYGAVRFQQACREVGIQGLIGAEILPAAVRNAPVSSQHLPHSLILLAVDLEGYANICRLLTQYHTRPTGDMRLNDHRDYKTGTICLTGSHASRLWQLLEANKLSKALDWARTLQSIYYDALYIELTYHAMPNERIILNRLKALAHHLSIPILASNAVRYATPNDFVRYDLLTCIRLGIPLNQPHSERSSNAEAYLKADLDHAIIPSEAFSNTLNVAEKCQCNLLKDQVLSPPARIPAQYSQQQYLAKLCYGGLMAKYDERVPDALHQLNAELAVIYDLQLEEFFLVVREVILESQRRGIRCAGRGSAANSIVAYLLDITGVDPIQHNLLFERFLHRGRKGTPDIDVDFDSERRGEIIAWIEERFGVEHTAMTATLTTFRLRLALREVIKTLGFPITIVNGVTKLVPRHEPHHVREYGNAIGSYLKTSELELILNLVECLQDCPRHLGLHSGGMVLSRQPLPYYTPVQVSANGVKVVQFDKDDVEALGLIKLDVLGLRMLAAVSETSELIQRHYGRDIALDHIPLDDPSVYDYICSGQTLGLFQIESQGQMHLIASHQPQCFNDLISEIALFRPGPLQGGMVHPFVRRRQGLEKVTYDHPDLESILSDTYGVILYQEQILEIANRFAGMSLEEADTFRSQMAKFREPKQMEGMRVRFRQGAVRRHIDKEIADRVFDKVSNFVGYGFCRSHAAAFAKTVYQSAWLKLYYPGPYMAAIMQHRPGMYTLQTLEEETKRQGILIAPPDLNQSAARYEIESTIHGWCIRKPLSSVKGISEDVAQRLLWSRLERPYTSIDDILHRVAIHGDDLKSLAKAGALDAISGSSRKALWEIGIATQRLHLFDAPRLFTLPSALPDEIPNLPSLSEHERIIWDLQTHSAGRIHPMALARRRLSDFAIQTIETCYRVNPLDTDRLRVAVAGTAMLKQRPPTAKGAMFITLEDETGYIQIVLFDQVQDEHKEMVRSPTMIVEGILQAKGNWRGIVAQKLYPLPGVSGGYAGFANAQGGRDQRVVASNTDKAIPTDGGMMPLKQA
jgi:error-prone DNA polymerase